MKRVLLVSTALVGAAVLSSQAWAEKASDRSSNVISASGLGAGAAVSEQVAQDDDRASPVLKPGSPFEVKLVGSVRVSLLYTNQDVENDGSTGLRQDFVIKDDNVDLSVIASATASNGIS